MTVRVHGAALGFVVVFAASMTVVLGGCAGARDAVDRRLGKGTAPRDDLSAACPTIVSETHGAFLVHGARVLAPADVLVANGEIVAVGAAICFRAASGSVSYVEGAGATLLAAVCDERAHRLSKRGRIAPGERADLISSTTTRAMVRSPRWISAPSGGVERWWATRAHLRRPRASRESAGSRTPAA